MICARNRCGRGVHQRHRVLQLVAESECAAGLIEPLRPQTRHADHLVNQPAVGNRVERVVGRLDHAPRRAVVPSARCSRSNDARAVAEWRKRRTSASTSAALRPAPKRKIRVRHPPSASSSGTWIGAARDRAARRHALLECAATDRGRVAQAAVAADEFAAVAGQRALRVIDVEERDEVGELRVVRIAREQCAVGVDLGDRRASRSGRRSPSTQCAVAGRGESCACAESLRSAGENLIGRFRIDVDAQLAGDAVLDRCSKTL